MSTHNSRVLPREGFYVDPLAKAIRLTLLNPWITLGVLLSMGSGATIAQSPLLRSVYHSYLIETLFVAGTLMELNDFLTKRYHNNWISDQSWDWDSEIVLVTGGSSGIGSSVVQQLISRNRRTVIIVVDYVPLTFTPADDSHVRFYQCDLSQAEEVRSVCARIKREVGDPTVLFNNAGLTRGATVMEGTYADVEVTFRTNIIAPFLLLKEFLPAMVAKNHGHIVGTSSMSSIIPPAGLADYAATKSGLASLHEVIPSSSHIGDVRTAKSTNVVEPQALALELKYKYNAPKIRISLFVLGFIKTPMFKGRTNQPRFLAPLLDVDTVGEKIVDVLWSGYGKNVYLPGLMRYISCVRGWPSWALRIFAESTESLQVDYVGRQKIDPVTGRMLERIMSWHNEHVALCQAIVSTAKATMPFDSSICCDHWVSIALTTAMLCQYCKSIDFSALPLQQDEEKRSPAWSSLPPELQQSDVGQYYYHRHHPSLPDLFDCSVSGCHFCIQIRRELFNIRRHESEDEDHQGPVEIRYYPHEAKTENDCRRLEIFAVALTPSRHVKLPFDFILPSAWLRTLLVQKSSLAPLSPKCQPNFELARNWMRICLETHKKCSHGRSMPTLPSRVLELFDDDDNETIRLASKGSTRSRYVTLSHVWGKTQIIRTLLENITQHHVAIPVEKLSKTFHDAVITVRKLGVRYLWIDSLCIIQDSKEDWEQEASKMGAYYRNATLTIAAVSAKGGEDGLFFERDFFAINPCPLQLRFAPPPQGLEQGFVRPALSWDSVSETSGFQRPPLWQRAWVLQERILSFRLLQFSDVQMSWRCHEFEASERLAEGSSKFFGYGRIEEALHSVIFREDNTSSREYQPNTAEEDDRLDLYNTWYDLVTLYTKCGLTVPTDIFPAISGIARLLGSELGNDYCAGIWKRDIHRGLVWTTPDSTVARTPLQSYRAPSWSWAAAPATVNFTVREILQEDVDFSVLEINDIKVESTPDAYGEVKHATLQVAGLLRSAHLSQGLTKEQMATMDTGGDKRDNRLFDLDFERSVGLFYPDASDNKQQSEVWCLLVWTEKSIVPSKRTREGKGLALKRLDAETGTFMRIGSVWVTDDEWMEQMQPANLSLV